MASSPASAAAADRRVARRRLAAAIVGAAAFLLYRATLLPGFDFGDTGSFQTIVGSPIITTRDGYPLYFAIGGAAVWLLGGDAAHVLNLLSAIEAGIACGLFVVVASELSGSLAAGAAGAMLFAASYTFWSQAIIAEVYALHLLFVLLTLLLMLRWAERPSLARLTLFFAAYALGFGNHLSMVLLLPGYTWFLLASAPGGWREMFRPRVVALAVVVAACGALQYLWNIRTLWLSPQPPPTVWAGLQTFWFDVTKTDWRDTMVLQVPRSMLTDHLAMYWFDLRQQFGPVVPWLAIVGLAAAFRTHWRRGVLLLLLYAVAVAFAFSYNVGDAHVFYLPSHLVIALLATMAIGVAARAAGPRGGTIAAAALATYAGARAYHDYPALDRSGDVRPAQVIEPLTRGVDDQHAILLVDLNWQIANGLSYYTKWIRPDVAFARMPEVLQYAPALVADNLSAGRDVALTQRARDEMESAYGPLLPTKPDPRVPVAPLSESVRGLAPGTRYLLCVLRPSRDLHLDADDLSRALETLTGGRLAKLPAGDYAAITGVAGAAPTVVAASDRPFRRDVRVDGVDVEIRMESWLASDTIRRMGFGQVVANRRHTLIVERGVSFAAFDANGRAVRTAYAANLFAPQPRYLVVR